MALAIKTAELCLCSDPPSGTLGLQYLRMLLSSSVHWRNISFSIGY